MHGANHFSTVLNEEVVEQTKNVSYVGEMQPKDRTDVNTSV